MKTKIEKLPKSTIKLEVTVPHKKVKETYDQVLAAATESAEIEGFRKGKAPKDIVEKSLDPAKLNGEVVNKLLEKYYIQALKEHKINPISNPKVEITQFEPGKDFEFTAKVATRPEVELGDYIKALEDKLEKRHKEVKKEKEEALKKGEKLENVHDHLHTQEIIQTIVENTEVEVPELLVEDEANRMKARLIDQMKNLEMEFEDYLEAQGKSKEEFAKELREQAEKNLKGEFALAQAVKEEGIEVSDEEIEETAKASGDPKALENLEDPVHKWYIRSVLEKNKLLTGIMEKLEEKGELVDHKKPEKTKKKSEEKKEEKGKEEKNE